MHAGGGRVMDRCANGGGGVMRRAITIWTKPDIEGSKRLIEELNAVGRLRSLNDPESLLLERSIAIVDGQRIPTGLNRGLARFGVSRHSYKIPRAAAR